MTLLQAPGGLVLLEEMLALGPNHFIGELWKPPTQHHVSVWCVETVYKEFSRIICVLAINTVPFILGEVPLIIKIAVEGNVSKVAQWGSAWVLDSRDVIRALAKGSQGVTFGVWCSEYQLLIPSFSGGFLQGSWTTGGIEFIC